MPLLVSISISAQQVTGIVNTPMGHTVNGEPVPLVWIKESLNKLTPWLENILNVSLVEHNERKFDFLLLITSLVKTGLVALVESLSVLRKLHQKC